MSKVLVDTELLRQVLYEPDGQKHGMALDALEALLEQPPVEPVAWLIRIGDAPNWSYCETEAESDFYGKQSGMRYEKKPLYTAPQAQQPAPKAQPAREPVNLGAEWVPCMKLPVVVHVRQQRPGEQHVSTREGITPVKPDDLIMRGVSGEEYPIGRAIFEQTYTLDVAAPQARTSQDVKQQPAPRNHITDGSDCWCNPEIVYTDPDTGTSVIVHKEPQ